MLRLVRIDRPIGWWLLLLPCWWSSALAAVATGQPYPDPLHLVLFLVGAIAMRGAGCVYNDIIDRDLDRQVTRTRNRPLASGAVSVKAALVLLAGLGGIGLLVLLSFNRFSIILGFCSIGPILVYPFMKRITSWPQAVLGLAFAWGGLIGWSAVTGSLSLAPCLIYLAAIFWTIGYDTIYAIQDFDDDSVAGIRSTPRLFGKSTQIMVGLFFILAMAMLVWAYAVTGTGLIAQAGLLAFALHLGWQVLNIDLKNPKMALKLFRSNRDAGLILFLGLSGDALLRL
jgi:4-hydroxybenzoate polyprenyltransferase